MSFLITPLPKSKFSHLLDLSPSDLLAHRALRAMADKKPGFPCRVSLVDAEVGEQVLLVNYEHLPVASPFRASHAVYIRLAAQQANLEPNEVPGMLRSRILSLRSFDAEGMLIEAGLADGKHVETAISDQLDNPQAAYVHIHFAKPGCYAARADRLNNFQ